MVSSTEIIIFYTYTPMFSMYVDDDDDDDDDGILLMSLRELTNPPPQQLRNNCAHRHNIVDTSKSP